MSRVGKQAISILEGVEVNIDGKLIKVKGSKGTLEYLIPSEDINIIKKDNKLILVRKNNSKKIRSLHGLIRTLINNMIIGVKQGYSKKLEIEGVGFRSQVQGRKLVLQLGFSHPVEYTFPEDIKVEIDENKKICISGFDKAKVGEVAAEIRNFYKPEPYKGKGIKYEGETIRRKAGKTIA